MSASLIEGVPRRLPHAANRGRGGRLCAVVPLAATIAILLAPSGSALDVGASLTLDHDITGVINVISNNVVIDGNGYALIADRPVPDAWYHGIKVQGMNNVTVRNFRAITGFYAGVYLSNCGTTRVENCVFLTNAFAGVYATGSQGDVTIGGNTFQGPYSGFVSDYVGSPAVVTNNTFLFGYQAIQATVCPTVANNRFAHQIKPAMIGIGTTTRVTNPGDTATFSLLLRHVDGSSGADVDCQVRAVPFEPVNVTRTEASVTGNVIFANPGLHTATAEATDVAGNCETRFLRFQVGPTTERTTKYYLSREYIDHGPNAGWGNLDMRALSFNQPAEIGDLYCAWWVQLSPNDPPAVPVIRMTGIDINSLLQFAPSGISPVMGVQREMTFDGMTMDKTNAISRVGNGYNWYETQFRDLSWTFDYPWEWLLPAVKVRVNAPFWRTGDPNYPSHVIFRYAVTTSPEVQQVSNPDVLLLGAVLDPQTNALITLDGTGSAGVQVAQFKRVFGGAKTRLYADGHSVFDATNMTGETSFASLPFEVTPSTNAVEIEVTNWTAVAMAWCARPVGAPGVLTFAVSALVADAKYDVRVDGAFQEQLTANSQGILTFTHSDSLPSGGRTFQVLKVGANDPPLYLSVTKPDNSPGNLVLQWPSADRRIYQIDMSSNLPGGFTTGSVNDIPSTPPVNTATITVQGATGFFRVVGREIPTP